MLRWTTRWQRWVPVVVLLLLFCGGPSGPDALPFVAVDPGVRGGEAGAGGALDGLSARQLYFFTTGLDDFEEVEIVRGSSARRRGLTVRLDQSTIERLTEIATEKGTGPSTLARIWILERLRAVS